MLAFDVNELFSFGSPLSLILAYRKLLTDNGLFFYLFLLKRKSNGNLFLSLILNSRSTVLWTIVQFISCM